MLPVLALMFTLSLQGLMVDGHCAPWKRCGVEVRAPGSQTDTSSDFTKVAVKTMMCLKGFSYSQRYDYEYLRNYFIALLYDFNTLVGTHQNYFKLLYLLPLVSFKTFQFLTFPIFSSPATER